MNPSQELPLSEEEQVYAAAVVACMSEAFAIRSEDIRLVIEEVSEGSGRVVAIDGSPNGQYAGVYDAIAERRSKEPRFLTIEVNGEIVDVLSASTEGAYRAMIEDARTRNVPLPDSLALSQHNGELWTATMLMGEPLTEDGLVQLLSVSGGTVNKVGFHTGRGGRSIRIRPAVAVGRIR